MIGWFSNTRIGVPVHVQSPNPVRPRPSLHGTLWKLPLFPNQYTKCLFSNSSIWFLFRSDWGRVGLPTADFNLSLYMRTTKILNEWDDGVKVLVAKWLEVHKVCLFLFVLFFLLLFVFLVIVFLLCSCSCSCYSCCFAVVVVYESSTCFAYFRFSPVFKKLNREKPKSDIFLLGTFSKKCMFHFSLGLPRVPCAANTTREKNHYFWFFKKMFWQRFSFLLQNRTLTLPWWDWAKPSNCRIRWVKMSKFCPKIP